VFRNPYAWRDTARIPMELVSACRLVSSDRAWRVAIVRVTIPAAMLG
jgi:hypothetical protein